jgi:hypothetical protein
MFENITHATTDELPVNMDDGHSAGEGSWEGGGTVRRATTISSSSATLTSAPGEALMLDPAPPSKTSPRALFPTSPGPV